MAFVQAPINQEQQNQFAPSGQTTPNPLSLLPPQETQTGGSAGQGGGQAGGPGVSPAQGTSTQFGSNASKLSDYLSANVDQVQSMAGNIAGNFGTQYSNIQGGIDQAAQQFGGQVQAGYTPTDPTLISQVQSNPTQAAADPKNVSKFQSMLNDQYTGPTSFEGSDLYGGVQKNVNEAVQNANLINTPSGLSTYLRNNVETNPTPGQNTLDTILLQGNQPAYQTVQDAVKPFNNLTGYLSSIAQTQNQGVQDAQAAAQTTKTGAQGAITTAAGNLSNQVQSALNAAQQKYGQNSTYAAIQNAVNNGQSLTAEQAQAIGINPADYAKQLALAQQVSSIYNNFKPSLADYFKPGQMISAPPSAANVATPDMYATAAALQQLAGQGLPGLALDPSQASQAGTFNPNVSAPTLDLPGATSAIRSTFSNDDLNAYNTWAANTIAGGLGSRDANLPYQQRLAQAGLIPNSFNGGQWFPTGGNLPGDPRPSAPPSTVNGIPVTWGSAVGLPANYFAFNSNPDVY